MSYYGIEWAYGRVAINNGNKADTMHWFSNRILLDEWVAERPTEITTDAGFREAVSISDPAILRAVRKAESDDHNWSMVKFGYGK